jgi:membrane protease YdiL (CAAX protease family)
MKKFKFRKIKFKKVNIHELNDRTLLLNLYGTQLFTLIIGIVIILFQSNNPAFPELWTNDARLYTALIWGASFALLVVSLDLVLSRWVPEHVTDDGGINDRIFKNRSLWHIAFISFAVAVCEEILFRGAIQHTIGPYWTSILFAAIHIRYLQHWLMTGLVFSISYGLGWIYLQTGTLWAPIIAHFMIDFIMGCIIRYRRET